MSNYSKTTDFASKDALASGNPSKVIKGTEHDTEYNAIAVAIATKADLNSPVLVTPNLGTPSAGVMTNVTGTAAGLTAGGNALLAGSASQAFAALAVNTAKTTVASATTPDIFAVTTGQLIDYTGTATCTGFVAAPQAGMFRELYCAGACLFTAGANLLIEGIPSGTTITLAAGALVQVRAITTTQFKMTYSLSGTFTATGTGFTANPTTTVKYKVENGIANLCFPYGELTGTSNSTSFSITGLPSCLAPITTKRTSTFFCIDNSVGVWGFAALAAGASTIALYSSLSGSSVSWTAAGTKQFAITELEYSIT